MNKPDLTPLFSASRSCRSFSQPESQSGNNIPIPNMKRPSAKRNLVKVVLIGDRLHDRDPFENENEGGADSDRLG